jgi:hypothetical protein
MLDTGEEHHVILHMAKFINICIDTTPIRKAFFTFFNENDQFFVN